MNSRSDPCPECGLYEAPPTRRTDLACSFCAPAGGEIREAALGLSTAALVWLSGADDNGDGWWMPGGFYFDQLEMSGRLLKLK